MKTTTLLPAVLLLSCACAQNAGERTKASSAPVVSEVPHASPHGDPHAMTAALSFSAPEGWFVEKPSSSMRKAQYSLPGEAGDAEVVVFHFGPGQGGPADANIARWKSQFSDLAGEPQVSKREISGIPVHLLDITGTYDSGMAMGMASGPKTGQRMRAAVFETEGGHWFVRLVGPAATVGKWSDSFDAYLDSVGTDG